jgi:hypothetical protein
MTGDVNGTPGFGVTPYPVKVGDGTIMVAVGEERAASSAITRSSPSGRSRHSVGTGVTPEKPRYSTISFLRL